jgi:hypothetical protein
MPRSTTSASRIACSLPGLGRPGTFLTFRTSISPSGVRVRDNRSQFFRLTRPLLCGWVNDLSRDGIRVDAPGHRMPAAVRYAALLLEVLGIHAEAPRCHGGPAPAPRE